MAESKPWHERERYYEGERCTWQGESYQATMDLPKGIRPTGEPDSGKFWRRVSWLPHHLRTPAKGASTPTVQRSAPTGYITRDYTLLTRR